MANIYSYAPEKWNYNSVARLSSNAFRFQGLNSYASSVITGAEIGELGGELFFRGFVSPVQQNLTQGLRCRLDIYSKQDAEQANWEVEKHFVYIKGDRNGAVNQKIATYGGTFDHIDLRLEVLQDAQMSLGGTIDLTSFIIGNASSTSVGNIEEEINAALPFLVYDTNKREQTNGGTDAEIYVGMIPVDMQRSNVDTDAGFRTNIAVDADGVLTQRYYRDNVEELLSPVIRDLKAGRHVITDDHAYLNVSKGSHTFLATLQFEGGTMDIDTRKTLYTIETSRAGMRDIAIEGNILDMAFSGVLNKNVPDKVWLMVKSLSDDVVRIQHGTFNPESQAISFQNDVEYPVDITSGALEFDGYWEKSQTVAGQKKFLSTEKPKALWLNENGSLTYGDFDKHATPQLTIEANGVVDCSLILGWNFKSTAQASNNMGMIASYIKTDGLAYYRTITDGAMDASPFPLTVVNATYPLVEIRSFRTNDYRVGFTVTDSNNNLHTVLTDRYWQGDSVESVYLKTEVGYKSVPFQITEQVFEVDRTSYLPISAVNPVDGQHIEITWDTMLAPAEDVPTITGIKMVDSAPVPRTITPTSVSVDENNRTIMHFVDMTTYGINTIVYLTNYGTMQEKYGNMGIDGFTAPLTLQVTGTNAKVRIPKKTYDSETNEWTHSYDLRSIPNSTLDVSNLTSHGTPDNPIPTVAEQDKSGEKLLSSLLGVNSVTMSYELFNMVDITIYGTYGRNHSLNCSFGASSIVYTPEVFELGLISVFEPSYYLESEFSADNVTYIVQAYTTNNIPI